MQSKLDFSKHSGESPPKKTKASVDIKKILLAQLKSIYDADPNHPMFGNKEKNKVRLPYDIVTRANSMTWKSLITNAVKRTETTMASLEITREDCWIYSGYNYAQIMGPNNVPYRHVPLYRLSNFLATPTQENWGYLSGDALDKPFSHFCGFNEKKGSDGIKRHCWNTTHGRFATKAENESHKLCQCKINCRALCPGHGVDKSNLAFCIFVDDNGRRLPCLNELQSMGPCEHTPKCFVPVTNA